MNALDWALRIALTTLQQARKAFWFLTRPETFGAHAIALTSEGKIVLVKLRYASGWRVPGGGRGADEDAVAAALRELREEIGLLSHGEAKLACEFSEAVAFKRDLASVVVVREVRYRPHWSLEVEGVREAALDALPDDLSPPSRRWIEGLRPLL